MELAQSLQVAVGHYRAGQFEQAAGVCRQVLAVAPSNVDALRILGMCLLQQGDARAAIEPLAQAVRVDSSRVELFTNLVMACHAAGETAQAIQYMRQALQLAPQSAELHNGLAQLLSEQGDVLGAETHFRQAVQCEPGRSEAHHNLGNFLYEQGKLDEAIDALTEACRILDASNQDHVYAGARLSPKQGGSTGQAASGADEPISEKAAAHHNLAVALAARAEHTKALEHEEAALRAMPGMLAAAMGRGIALLELRRLEEAAGAFERAVALAPEGAAGHHNLGVARQRLEQYEAARQAYAQAARLDGTNADTYLNLSGCLESLGDYPAAIETARRAIEINPNHNQAHFAYAQLLMSFGRFEEAYPHYDYRLKLRPERDYSYQMWNGEALGGADILVQAEWGFGDVFQFLRYIPLVRERGGQVTIEARRAILPLLAESGYESLLPAGDPGASDFAHKIPLMCLPRVFGTRMETIPAHVPYLRARPALVEEWRERLASIPGFKIGVNWHGEERGEWKDTRAFPLSEVAPLASIDGVTLISLQKRRGAQQLPGVQERFRVLDFGDELDTRHGAFLDTAAIMMNLDLVISSDTSIAHLAGALNVPVWIALRRGADWRWFHNRQDSPWYPSARLFRQPRPGAWPEVFAAMAAELKKLLASRRV